MFFNQRNDRALSNTRRTSTPATVQSFATNQQPANGYLYSNMNNNAYTNTMPLAVSSANYKLYYFPIRNTAEASRMILAYAGVPFEDIRISANEWPKWKASKEKNQKRQQFNNNGSNFFGKNWFKPANFVQFQKCPNKLFPFC